jgi:hypothetical protein
MKLITQVAFQLVTLLLTFLIWERYGFVGILIGLPIAFAIGYFGAGIKHRWRQRR